MIKKERLEELIEQGATVCNAYKDWDNVWHCRFGNVVQEENHLLFKENGSSLSVIMHDTNNLYETKEQAEWEWEFSCIERTERLEFPTWQQIENIIEQKKKFGLNHSDRVLARIITRDSIYYFKLCKDLDLFTFELKQNYIGEDLCEQLTSRFPVSLGKATKSNYEKACRKCKELFLGEK